MRVVVARPLRDHARHQRPVQPQGRQQVQGQLGLPFRITQGREAAAGGGGAAKHVDDDVGATHPVPHSVGDDLASFRRGQIGGDEQRVSNISTEYSNITFKHLLLPVYAGAYRYNNKVFQIVVNGRTGEVQGERPYSWLKIGCLVVVILFVLLIILGVFAAR